MVLENGRMIQWGTHDKLMEQEGYYKELYFNQLSSKEN